ncbi:DUF3558 domain-containing protein [Umezawaea beigongshangensis]|uniref:DUF3558 domain-containing protein n=1 Tax=Umezawaea beigongshangensis TaxID=2780383 RepID=UPI0018F148E2|nr:DUF3558 domain-containing protein [Umezawaea beigongshangensis]
MLAILIIGIAISSVTACSEDSTGRATPGNSTRPSSSSTNTVESSTSISSQLSFDAFKSKPCDILTAQQVASLGTFDPPEAENDALGPSCRLDGKDISVDPSYEVTFLTDGSTIESIRENAGSYAVSRETEIDSYPAVIFDSTDGLLNCSTAVGIATDQVFLAQTNITEKDPDYSGNACAAAENLASLVLESLKG